MVSLSRPPTALTVLMSKCCYDLTQVVAKDPDEVVRMGLTYSL
ncbi:hypothetical protein C4J99_4800 [Pseudomonas synxantha]|nr:hypothetical protein C4J99_4800 [Pseudomonas synxantha]